MASANLELEGAAGVSWRNTDWVWRGASARLDLFAARAASGIGIKLDEFPVRGTVVEVRLDGAQVAVVPALDREGLNVPTPVSRGAHLVEITALAGGRVVPGELSLAEGGER